MTKMTLFLFLAAMLVLVQTADAQVFQPTGTTTLNVTVAAEASLYINDSSTTLTGGPLFADYTGTTNLTYKIRTSQGAGTGTITSLVTADFSPAGGPSVAGNTLAYTCSVSAPATSCSGSRVASTTVAQPVASFGSNARSARAGNGGQVNWTLTNDPQYQTGAYTATVTFTVSAT